MENFEHLIQYILHIDTYLIAFVAAYGVWAYAVLFLIIFCETGFVITPFLPGDSLLFAAGSIAARSNEAFSMQLLFVLLVLASILGNKLNYLIGRYIGRHVFVADTSSSLLSCLVNRKHLERAHQFYEKHGGKTIIFARFIPIIRTFAPFVAGMGYMSLTLFSFYNILSALLWIGSLLAAGYYLGSLPFIQEHFSLVIYGIIALSLIPPIFTYFYQKIKALQQ